MGGGEVIVQELSVSQSHLADSLLRLAMKIYKEKSPWFVKWAYRKLCWGRFFLISTEGSNKPVPDPLLVPGQLERMSLRQNGEVKPFPRLVFRDE